MRLVSAVVAALAFTGCTQLLPGSDIARRDAGLSTRPVDAGENVDRDSTAAVLIDGAVSVADSTLPVDIDSTTAAGPPDDANPGDELPVAAAGDACIDPDPACRKAVASPPVTYPGVSSWSQRACAVVDGGVLCWGFDPFQPDDAGADAIAGARPITMADGGPLTGVLQVAVGYEHVCALRDAGDIVCWGDQLWGETGTRSVEPKLHPDDPVPVDAGVSFRWVAAKGGGGVPPGDPRGGFTCAIDEEGGVWCWGMDEDGALGRESDAASPLDAGSMIFPASGPPTRIEGLTNAVMLALDDAGGCALRGDSTIVCWGWNRDGEVSDASGELPVVRSDVFAGLVWAGHATACASFSYGVQCWGSNSEGQLGLGDDAAAVEARATAFGTTAVYSWSSVAIGWGHLCAVTSQQGVDCAGWNGEYELGWGFRTQVDSGPCPSCSARALGVVGPGGIVLPFEVRELSAGWASTCAVASDGAVYCWGYNGDARTGGATGHPAGTMGDVPCDPPPFLPPGDDAGATYCTPYPTPVIGLP
jgi:alpha-tubulin suppressor-like RCC1 family protein